MMMSYALLSVLGGVLRYAWLILGTVVLYRVLERAPSFI